MEITITFWGLTLALTLVFFCGAAFSLVGVTLGGFLVLRARGNGYDPILPPLKNKDDNEPVNLDEFEEKEVDLGQYDEIIEKMFEERLKEDPNPVEAANSAFKRQQADERRDDA